MKFKFKTSLVFLFTFFISSHLVLAQSKEKSQSIEIRIFSATWCGPCRNLHHLLEQAKSTEQLELEIFGKKNIASVKTILEDEPGSDQKITGYFPETQLFLNGVRVGHTEGGADSLDIFKKRCSEVVENGIFDQLVDFSSIQSQAVFENKTLKNTALLFIGTGSEPKENPIFVGNTIKDIKQTLYSKTGSSHFNSFTLYGASNPVEKNGEAMAVLDPKHPSSYQGVPIPGLPNGIFTQVSGVGADASFNRDNLLASLKKIENSKVKNILIVSVGHGSQDGMPTWKKKVRLNSEAFKHDFYLAHKNTVVVSGNCYGGQFAQSVDCGFFAARPDTQAEGCTAQTYLDQSAVKDYSSSFFHALDAHAQTQVDLNKDGKISFSEAHFSTVSRETDDVIYTTFDSYADQYFTAHDPAFASPLSLEEVEKLYSYGSAEEVAALKKVLKKHQFKNGKQINSFYLVSLAIPSAQTITYKSKNTDQNTLLSFSLEGSFILDPFAKDGDSLIYFNFSRKSVSDLKTAIEQILNTTTQGLRSASLRVSESDSSKYDILVAYVGNDGKTYGINFEKILSIPNNFQALAPAEVGSSASGKYQRGIPQLIRRLYFKKMMAEGKVGKDILDPAKSALLCESQSIEEFLK